MIKDCIIIGSGISGLAAAYFLKDVSSCTGAVSDFLVLEKNSRTGGCILTEKADGFTIEGGPDCFISEKPWALALCRKLNLDKSILWTNEDKKGTAVYFKGKLHPLPEGVILMIPTRITPFLTSSLLTWKGKIRAGMDLFLPRKNTENDESLGSFVRRRLGEEVLIRIAEPLVAGIHAGSPENMSLRSTFPGFIEIEKKYRSLIIGMLARKRQMNLIRRSGDLRESATFFVTLKNGLSEIVETLSERIGHDSIMINSRVNALSRNNGFWEILLDSGAKILSKAVILTCPAFEAAKIVAGFDRNLSESLLSIPYVSTATVSFGFRTRDVPGIQNGFGAVIPKSENRKIMAATFTSSKFNHRAPDGFSLMRCFLGGVHDPEMTEKSEDEIITAAMEETRRIFGISADPVIKKAYVWKNSMAQFTINHRVKISSICDQLKFHRGLFLTGSAYRATGISDCIHEAELTAEQVIRYLSRSIHEIFDGFVRG